MTFGQFTTVEAARICGFSVRQLDYWATNGMVPPSIKRSCGPGTRRLYSFDDLVKLRLVKQLREVGWSIQKIRKALESLIMFTNEGLPFRNAVLVHDENSILLLCETEEKQQILLDALSPSGQQVLLIVLEILRDETRKCAEKELSVTDIVSHQLDLAV